MKFIQEYPSLESYWRSVILFGRNVASYKFAFGKSLLEFADQDKTFVTLEELAVPFSTHLAEHLSQNPKQGTSPSSRFLEACRNFNDQKISKEELVAATVKLGFNNVIDAFHIVNQAEIPTRFFEDNRKESRKGIVITDELLQLRDSVQFGDLPSEVESRWRLVETAWELGIGRRPLEVHYDNDDSMLYTPHLRRASITSCRDALNGYQKGKCFYCFDDISVDPLSPRLAEVDHFFPHRLKEYVVKANIDGVWNLVLACQSCNRGIGGKMMRVPKMKYLERLHRRNSFLIDSHHPLRDTLMTQTGSTEQQRRDFLQEMDSWAIGLLIHRWHPMTEFAPCF